MILVRISDDISKSSQSGMFDYVGMLFGSLFEHVELALH